MRLHINLEKDLAAMLNAHVKETYSTKTRIVKMALLSYLSNDHQMTIKKAVASSKEVTKAICTKSQTGPEFDIFKEYCMSWNKNPNKYQLTPQRKKWIKEAITSYSYEEALNAVKAFRNDSFKDRAKHNGIEYLFGKRERLDKWCSKPITAYDQQYNEAKQRHEKSQARLKLAIALSEEREKNEQKK